jgi:hypothetical protein
MASFVSAAATTEHLPVVAENTYQKAFDCSEEPQGAPAPVK